MIGGQDHHVIDPRCIEVIEQAADVFVELGHLDAHFHPFGAGGVADVIGRRERDREDVGRAALAEAHLVNQTVG